MRLVQDLDHDVYLVHLSIVSQLFPHTTEDLGESSLSKALVLKDGFMRKFKKSALEMGLSAFSESKRFIFLVSP